MRQVCVVVGLFLAASGVYLAETRDFTTAEKGFWSFQPVVKPAVPAVKDRPWVKNPIDAFVLSKLEQKQIQPNKPAGNNKPSATVDQGTGGLY